LPTGTTVSYANNSRTDAGTQEVTATISGSNYTTLELKADLTITKAAISGITENNLRVKIYRIKKQLTEIYNSYERL
jgi:hypothetical protein